MNERRVVANTRQLQDADALLARGDFRAASGKLWDAVEIAVKAASHEWTAEGPRDIRRLVEQLFQRTGDRDLLRLYTVVESLSANSRENFMSGEVVKAYAEDARAFLDRLGNVPESADAASAGAAAAGPPAGDALVPRQQDFERRLNGLGRKDARTEILGELLRTGEQIQAVSGRQRSEGAVPGFTAARIAGLMRGLEAAPLTTHATADLLGRYQSWLLALLAGTEASPT